MDGVVAAAQFILQQMDMIWSVCTGSILLLPIVLWVLDRLVNIFDVLKH